MEKEVKMKEGRIKAYALDEDNKKSAPRIIWKYQYVVERVPINWLLVSLLALLFWIALINNEIEKDFKEHMVLSIINIVLSIPFLLICIMGIKIVKDALEERKYFLERIQKARKQKEIYQGEIIAYRIKANISSWRSKSLYVDKLTYILVVQVDENGVLKKFDTPELKYNPVSVLKSNRCTVYKYKKDYYALDFELRTKKTDGTADISKRYVCVDKDWLVTDRMEDFKRKSRKRR